MAERIVITATGIISAIGKGQDQHLQALLSGQDGLAHPQFLPTAHARDYVIGEVTQSNDSLAENLSLPTGDNGYTRTTLLALTAFQDLLQQVNKSLLRDNSLAFINANTVGGMSAVENKYMDFISEKESGDFIKYIDTLDCAESTENVARHFGIKPFMTTISTACSSSANAIIVGERMIKQGLVERAICGGCDAMSRFTLNGFLSLKNVSKTPCRPFDQERNGLNLGEGAGYVMLEKESDARKRNAPILAVLSGWSNTNDAYHPTAPSPDGTGALRTMNEAISKAGITAEEVGYINAHGTATLNNDVAEGIAIEKFFGKKGTFSSTKSFTGHTLAAAGSIEAIFSIWALQQKAAFANLNFENQMEEISIAPVQKLTSIPDLKHVLSNSFGFGGTNVSLLFSAP